MSEEIKCTHDYVDNEDAIANGMCAICLALKIDALTDSLSQKEADLKNIKDAIESFIIANATQTREERAAASTHMLEVAGLTGWLPIKSQDGEAK